MTAEHPVEIVGEKLRAIDALDQEGQARG